MDLDAGTTVYRANVFADPTSTHSPYYIDTATVTEVVLDGVPMVRMHTLLMPLAGGIGTWRATEAEAKRDAWRQLVQMAGKLQAVADKVMDEIEHDDLTQEAAA